MGSRAVLPRYGLFTQVGKALPLPSLEGRLRKLDEPLGRCAKGLLPLPGQDTGGRQRRLQRAEGEAGWVPKGHRPANEQGAGQFLMHQHRTGGGQVGGKQDVLPVKGLPKPTGQFTLDHGPVGQDQRGPQQIPRGDPRQLGQGRLGMHGHHPLLRLGEAEVVILLHVHRLQQQPQVG